MRTEGILFVMFGLLAILAGGTSVWSTRVAIETDIYSAPWIMASVLSSCGAAIFVVAISAAVFASRVLLER